MATCEAGNPELREVAQMHASKVVKFKAELHSQCKSQIAELNALKLDKIISEGTAGNH